jgi:hypothetical protein
MFPLRNLSRPRVTLSLHDTKLTLSSTKSLGHVAFKFYLSVDRTLEYS